MNPNSNPSQPLVGHVTYAPDYHSLIPSKELADLKPSGKRYNSVADLVAANAANMPNTIKEQFDLLNATLEEVSKLRVLLKGAYDALHLYADNMGTDALGKAFFSHLLDLDRGRLAGTIIKLIDEKAPQSKSVENEKEPIKC